MPKRKGGSIKASMKALEPLVEKVLRNMIRKEQAAVADEPPDERPAKKAGKKTKHEEEGLRGSDAAVAAKPVGKKRVVKQEAPGVAVAAVASSSKSYQTRPEEKVSTSAKRKAHSASASAAVAAPKAVKEPRTPSAPAASAAVAVRPKAAGSLENKKTGQNPSGSEEESDYSYYSESESQPEPSKPTAAPGGTETTAFKALPKKRPQKTETESQLRPRGSVVQALASHRGRPGPTTAPTKKDVVERAGKGLEEPGRTRKDESRSPARRDADSRGRLRVRLRSRSRGRVPTPDTDLSGEDFEDTTAPPGSKAPDERDGAEQRGHAPATPAVAGVDAAAQHASVSFNGVLASWVITPSCLAADLTRFARETPAQVVMATFHPSARYRKGCMTALREGLKEAHPHWGYVSLANDGGMVMFRKSLVRDASAKAVVTVEGFHFQVVDLTLWRGGNTAVAVCCHWVDSLPPMEHLRQIRWPKAFRVAFLHDLVSHSVTFLGGFFPVTADDLLVVAEGAGAVGGQPLSVTWEIQTKARPTTLRVTGRPLEFFRDWTDSAVAESARDEWFRRKGWLRGYVTHPAYLFVLGNARVVRPPASDRPPRLVPWLYPQKDALGEWAIGDKDVPQWFDGDDRSCGQEGLLVKQKATNPHWWWVEGLHQIITWAGEPRGGRKNEKRCRGGPCAPHQWQTGSAGVDPEEVTTGIHSTPLPAAVAASTPRPGCSGDEAKKEEPQALADLVRGDGQEGKGAPADDEVVAVAAVAALTAGDDKQAIATEQRGEKVGDNQEASTSSNAEATSAPKQESKEEVEPQLRSPREASPDNGMDEVPDFD